MSSSSTTSASSSLALSVQSLSRSLTRLLARVRVLECRLEDLVKHLHLEEVPLEDAMESNETEPLSDEETPLLCKEPRPSLPSLNPR